MWKYQSGGVSLRHTTYFIWPMWFKFPKHMAKSIFQNFTDISQNSVIIPDLQSPMGATQPLTFEAFDSLHDLKEHKHLEHQHKCGQCQRSFSDTVSYNRHTRNAHIHKLSKVNYPSLGYWNNRSLILHYSDNPEQWGGRWPRGNVAGFTIRE